MPKLAVTYPWTSPFVYRRWADTMLNLQRPPGWDTRFFAGEGWCPARRHTDGCEKALAWGADLLCIVGADQVHPEDLLPRLLARWDETGGEVIAALVPARGYVGWQPMQPFQRMAWRFRYNLTGVNQPLGQYRGRGLDPEMIEVIDPAAGALQRVHFIGSGVLLFHRDHLLALTRPWFQETIRPEDYQRVANQDCLFVWRLQREAYAQVWVDTTIQVRHLNIHEVDETYSDRFADWAQPGVGDPALCRYGPDPRGNGHVPETAT